MVSAHRRGQNLTLLAARTAAGCGAAMTLDGAADAPAFAAHVREVPVPTLRPGQVAIRDDLSANKGRAIRALIEAAGGAGCPLPPPARTTHPSSRRSASARRRAQARPGAPLEAAIAGVLALLTPADAPAWFAHCGYGARPAQSNSSATRSRADASCWSLGEEAVRVLASRAARLPRLVRS